MDSFEKISKMDLAKLESPEGVHSEGDIEQEAFDPESGDGQLVEETKNEQAGEEKEPEKKEMMEPQGKHYLINTEIGQDEIVAFLMGHTYRQPLVLIASVLAIIWLVVVVAKQQGNYLMPIVGVLFMFVWFPFFTYTKGKKVKKDNPLYQKEFHYMLDEWGIHLELGDDAIDVEWKRVTKTVFFKKVDVVYTGRNNAFLIPTAALEGRKEEIEEFIKENQKKK